MRVRIIFALKNRGGFVPFHHQFMLAQVIKGLIVSGGNMRFADYIGYNFSGLKGQIKISRKGLHFFSSKVTLVFSSTDKDFLDYFLKILFAQSDLMIGNLHLVPETVENEDPIVITESVKFLCISPLVLLKPSFNEDSAKRFIEPDADEFSDLLYDSTIARMEASGNYTVSELGQYYKFQVVPDQDYLQRIKSTGKKFSRIYPLYDSDVKFEVRGYTFPFTMYAPLPVQQFVYENGLGQFSHKGFGMLDVAAADSSSTSTQNSQEINYA